MTTPIQTLQGVQEVCDLVKQSLAEGQKAHVDPIYRDGRYAFAVTDQTLQYRFSHDGMDWAAEYRNTVIDPPEQWTDLEDGPNVNSQAVDVADWALEVMGVGPQGRTYVGGLPVIIMVNNDGTVKASVDLSEADGIVWDDSSVQPKDEQTRRDDFERIHKALTGEVEVTRADR